MKLKILIFISSFIFLTNCKKDEVSNQTIACNSTGLLETFKAPDGIDYFLYEDGKLYSQSDGNCTFALQYFEPGFVENNYQTNNDGTFIIADGGVLFPTKSNYIEDFESTLNFTDLFLASFADTHLYWTNFTVQSPAAPEVADYVALRQCIMAGTCSFIDNKIELVNDPTNSLNRVIKFTSVAPTANMVTSKSSMSSSLNFYPKDSEVWFEADYLIESGMPFSIVDFECSYMEQSPGPRVVIRNNKLEFENKFGTKLNFENTSSISISQNQWFKLKVHLKYSNESSGVIEVWHDGTLIISTTGINLPTSNAIQNILEIGASASSTGCVLLMDNIRISNSPF